MLVSKHGIPPQCTLASMNAEFQRHLEGVRWTTKHRLNILGPRIEFRFPLWPTDATGKMLSDLAGLPPSFGLAQVDQ